MVVGGIDLNLGDARSFQRQRDHASSAQRPSTAIILSAAASVRLGDRDFRSNRRRVKPEILFGIDLSFIRFFGCRCRTSSPLASW